MPAAVPWLTSAGNGAAIHAATLGLQPVRHKPETGFYLQSEASGLTLHHADAPPRDTGLRMDFLDGAIERRQAGGRKSALARALGLHRHPRSRVLDTTCGLGRDAATIAALGCELQALERHPVLFALLDDALARARGASEAPAWLAHWNTLEYADARRWLEGMPPGRFDVIYIDPMFESPRRKARPQKALAWLGELLGPDADAAALLAIARRHASRQTVVKQHTRATPLAPPDRQFTGKSVRFDIYLAAP